MKLKDLYNNDEFINILKEKLERVDVNQIEYAIIRFESVEGGEFYAELSDTPHDLGFVFRGVKFSPAHLKQMINEYLTGICDIWHEGIKRKAERLIDLEDEIEIFIELKYETKHAKNLDELKEVDFNIVKEGKNEI